MSGKPSVDFELVCVSCRREHGLLSRAIGCESCGSALTLRFRGLRVGGLDEVVDHKDFSMWRYSRVMPFPHARVSLGEGLTPVVKSRLLGKTVVFKLEYMAPTGSFKDRGASTSITRARVLGVRGVIEDSSGNAGVSYAAYSSAARLRARVYVPRDAEQNKKTLIASLGAVVVEARDREEASRLARGAQDDEWMYVGHPTDPFFLEGVKTIAYEVQEQLGWDGVSDVIIPVASGTLLLGLWKGLLELLELGVVTRLPRVHVVQAEGYDPVHQAVKRGGAVVRGGGASRLADGLRVRSPPRLREIVDVVLRTRGEAVVVGDNEILEAVKELYRMGFVVEPSSATVYAALKKLRGFVGETVLLPLTGTGLKTSVALRLAGGL